jgi:hypothetical protein
MTALSLLELDALEALEPRPSMTAAAVAVECNLELGRTLSVLNSLRRLQLVRIFASGLGTETRWKITELGRQERVRNAQLRLAP